MNALHKTLTVLTLTSFFISCGGEKSLEGNFSITLDAEKNAVQNGNEVAASLNAKKDIALDSVVYYLDGTRLGAKKDKGPFTFKASAKKLGQHLITATIYADGERTTTEQKLNILNTQPPKVYTYKIINRYPHQTDAYTQGLEFVGDTLYESNGQYGKSTLRKLDYKTGEVLKEEKLDDAYFAEGMTIVGDKIYQLTWQENTGFIYDLNTFETVGTFNYNQSKQGWGLANDGTKIFKSDGSSKIWTLDITNLAEQDYIEPTDHSKVTSKLNELEFVNGKIYANNYQVDLISIINPDTGAIEGLVDLRTLKNEVQKGLDPANDVLNGIAFKENEGRLFVTGKNWNTLFEIEIVEK